MCGFLFAPRYKFMSDAEKETCVRATETMGHRGIRSSFQTDAYGFWGHIRLPIVDKSPERDHPRRFIWAGTPVVGMMVGEVFNYKDFDDAAELDLDVMLTSFFNYGFQKFHDFDGFWAGVIGLNGTSYIFTDYLAQKPIYYRQDVQVFASELRPLLEFGPLPLDPIYMGAVTQFGYDPSDRTPFEGINTVPPGSYMAFRDNDFSDIGKCWDWNQVKEVPLAHAIQAATARRVLGGQYPVAVMLSGGVDSTIVAKLAHLVKPDLTVFHVENEEAEFAEMVNLPGAIHHKVTLDAFDISGAILANQSPVDLGSVLPQFALGRALEKLGFNVALSGDGADELFGGYSRARYYDSRGHDIFLELPYYHLRRLDALMMASTVELRSPFLSAPVVAGAMKLPRKQHIGKRWLKETFSTLIPKEIRDREKKPLRSKHYTHNSMDYRLGMQALFRNAFENFIQKDQ